MLPSLPRSLPPFLPPSRRSAVAQPSTHLWLSWDDVASGRAVALAHSAAAAAVAELRLDAASSFCSEPSPRYALASPGAARGRGAAPATRGRAAAGAGWDEGGEGGDTLDEEDWRWEDERDEGVEGGEDDFWEDEDDEEEEGGDGEWDGVGEYRAGQGLRTSGSRSAEVDQRHDWFNNDDTDESDNDDNEVGAIVLFHLSAPSTPLNTMSIVFNNVVQVNHKVFSAR